MDKFNKNIL